MLLRKIEIEISEYIELFLTSVEPSTHEADDAQNRLIVVLVDRCQYT